MMDSPPDFNHQQRASSVLTTGGSDSETGSYDGNGLGTGSFGGKTFETLLSVGLILLVK